ncbi:MAG: double-strand break repair protein AddB [Sphingorhabdus sp.]|nr:double-strand break repair protein AddB [Sphingorhabdus sp.]
MAEAIRAKVQTVPVGTDLSGALSDWLVERYRDDLLGLADVTLFLPNNRAVSALTSAFVRSADKGLVLPRMVAIGDLALDEKLGPLLDPFSQDETTPFPAVPDIERLLKLVALIRQERGDASAAEALHLAKQLVQTLNELEVEEKSIHDIELDHDNADLADHWSKAYDSLKLLCRQSESWLAERHLLSPAARRNALLDRLKQRLKTNPPVAPVIAAGITTAAPAIANLLSQIAGLSQGLVLLPHVDLTMPETDWDALGNFDVPAEGSDTAKAPRQQETHPQYNLKLLLHRMGVRRDEVTAFPGKSAATLRGAHLSQAVQDIFCIAEKTVEWQGLSPKRRSLDHVRLVEAEDSAEEARAISVLIREAIESPGKRVALVTPDREIASRVAAQLLRWNIEADDSAGEPLAEQPAGVLFLTLSQMLASGLAPVPSLSAFKHPLVRSGEGRLEWLEQVRALDMVLRGPQMRTGAGAISQVIAEKVADKRADPKLSAWWSVVETELLPQVSSGRRNLAAHLDAVTRTAEHLTDGAIWKGAGGRRLAEFVEDLSAQKLDALSDADGLSYPDLLASMLADISIRPAYGRHPRVAIYGLLEARLQSADLVICAGLNESSWPQLPQPDPWLAPHLRRRLDMPGLDRNIGLSAHDLASALGAPEVVLTRARRDRSGPTIASRFLLRLQALMGERLQIETRAVNLGKQLDRVEKLTGDYPRPAPMPLPEQRKVAISITQMDMLKADPYAFYARNILKLDALKPVDADPDPAWKGTLVHKIIEDWTKTGDRIPDNLIRFAENVLSDRSVTPELRLLWQPRIMAGMQWVASEIEANAQAGREIAASEVRAEGEISGIRVHGRIDRIDRQADGKLVVVDYKTGGPPSKGKVNAGYALQLGLAGLLVETGGVKEVAGEVGGYEYWSLSKKDGEFGYCEPTFAKKPTDGQPDAATFVSFADGKASEVIAERIFGDAPFTAKLKPDYAVYKDYDQLMRLDEWLGGANWNEVGDVD